MDHQHELNLLDDKILEDTENKNDIIFEEIKNKKENCIEE